MQSLFARIRTLNPELARLQDNVGYVLDAIAKALITTPIMGAPAPAWIRPDLGAGWTQRPGFATPGFHKDALGYVHIKASVDNTSGGPLATSIFTLPRGYRPAESNDLAVSTSGGNVSAVTIAPSGTITPDANVPNNGFINITVTFLAEQ